MAPSDLASFLAGEPPAFDAGVAGTVPVAPASAAAASGVAEPGVTAPGVAAPGGAASGAGSAKVVLNDRFEIDPARPLADFTHAGADAFAAGRLDSGNAELFAYVARSGLPARHDILPAVRAIEHAGILNLVSHGFATWPPDGVERLIVIYERPVRRLVAAIDAIGAPMREDEIVRVLVRPAVAALEELKRRRIVHGAINPANMFVSGGDGAGGDGQPLRIGDFVTAPSGFMQPAAFETIGRAMASPAGRGIATIADDLYALGVSIVFMMLGRRPGGDCDDQSLIAAKIESGSFSALVQDANLSQFITEPVRGLLLDDPDRRWTLDDLRSWLGGRRQSPRRAEIVGRLQRPVSFKGRDFLNIRLLAAEMATDSAAADSIIEDGTLEESLARAVHNDELQTRIAEAKRTASLARPGPLRERRVARVLMALDPQAPIRYQGQAVMPEGIGSALAQAVTAGHGLQDLAEIIAAQLPMAWISFQGTQDGSVVLLVRQFDMLSGFVAESGLGYGVERCLYELDGSIPCAGPLTQGRQIPDAKSLLLALESFATRSDRPREPIDRHIAAFLASRHARLIHAPIMVLSADTTPELRCAALVDFYDILQRRAGVSRLPQLCRWLVSLAEPVIAGYHSRGLRGMLKAEIDTVWKSGSIHDLKAFIGNAPLAERDGRGFRAATAAHADAARSVRARRRELERKAEIAAVQGRQAAAIIACLLSVMMAIGAVIVTVF